MGPVRNDRQRKTALSGRLFFLYLFSTYLLALLIPLSLLHFCTYPLALFVFLSLINPFSLPHLDHYNNNFVIEDLIQDPIFTLPHTIFFFARKFFTTMRAGVFGKALDSVNDPRTILLRDGLDLLHRRRFDKYLIGRHVFSGPGLPPRSPC